MRLSRSGLIFIFLVSILATLFSYELGESDHLTQVPLILQQMNTEFLSNDFFIAANDAFSPRWYYSRLMALGSQMMSLPIFFFVISLLVAGLTAYFTALTTHFIFKNEIAAILSVIFLFGLPTPMLALSTFTTFEGLLTPTTLIFPLLIIAFYRFLVKDELVLPLLLVSLASLFQQLYGLMAGLLFLFAYAVVHFQMGIQRKQIVQLLAAGGIWTAFACIHLYPYWQSTTANAISTEQFIDFLARFRAPHHYLPSSFPLNDWVLSIFFFSASGGIILQAISKHTAENNHTHAIIHRKMLLMCLAILIGFVFGYVFVEIIPTRLLTTAQLFRYVLLMKWMSIVVFAGYFGELIQTDKAIHKIAPPLPLIGALHPVSLLVSVLPSFLPSLARLAMTTQMFLLTQGVILILAFLILPLSGVIGVLFFIMLKIAFWLYEYWNSRHANILLGIAIAGLAALPFVSDRMLPDAIHQQVLKIAPKYDYSFTHNENMTSLVQEIRQKTPTNAILLTPPDLPQFRYAVPRAIVVDFKSFPFQDRAMLEWRERIRFCYGETNKNGFEALEDLNAKYQDINATKLIAIQQLYGADFAILPIENDITDGIIYQNKQFKLIAINTLKSSINTPT